MNLNRIIPLTLDESGWAYNGPFSTYKEAHSFILGFGAGVAGEPTLSAAVASYAVGRGVTKKRDDGKRADAHWRQVAEEPAYAVGALALGTFARNQGLVSSTLSAATGLL